MPLGETDDDAVRNAVLRGMLHGLAGRRNLPSPDGWSQLKTSLQKATMHRFANLPSSLPRSLVTRKRLNVQSRHFAAGSTDSGSAIGSQIAALQQHREVMAELEPLLDEPDLRLDAHSCLRCDRIPDRSKAMLLSRYDSLDTPPNVPSSRH